MADEYELSMFARVIKQEKCKESGYANLNDLIVAYEWEDLVCGYDNFILSSLA